MRQSGQIHAPKKGIYDGEIVGGEMDPRAQGDLREVPECGSYGPLSSGEIPWLTGTWWAPYTFYRS